MDWRQNKLDEIHSEQKTYDPELVWNIEGPSRKKTDAARRQAVNAEIKKVNSVQRVGFHQLKVE